MKSPVTKESYTANDEQLPAIRSQAKKILINAGAGSGKTHTLIGIALERPHENMLYIAYNKAIQLEAASKFPANVQCRTMHSIAWPTAKRLFGTLTDVKIGNTRTYEISKRFGIHPAMANAALSTLMAWMCTADENVGLEHIPTDLRINQDDFEIVVSNANDIWKAMLDKDDTSIKMPHDGYLKVFQLGKPIIRGPLVKNQKVNYLTILLDEYQDSNALMLDIMKRQPTNLVYVGDEHQSIYAFRGAVNAKAYIEADETFYLTYSYRFGPPIAAMANAFLGFYKENHRPLIGEGKCKETRFQIDESKSYAVIARSNAFLFAIAAAKLERQVEYSFIGGVEGYKFNIILDTYYLYAHNLSAIQDPFIRRFESFAEMDEVAKQTKDRELAYLVKTVLAYTDRIPQLIEDIYARHVDVRKEDIDSFEGIFFATAHKSKGLEFMQVLLTDDYVELVSETGELLSREKADQQEINVLHVAYSRAKEAIAINLGFARFLHKISGGDKQTFPALSYAPLYDIEDDDDTDFLPTENRELSIDDEDEAIYLPAAYRDNDVSNGISNEDAWQQSAEDFGSAEFIPSGVFDDAPIYMPPPQDDEELAVLATPASIVTSPTPVNALAPMPRQRKHAGPAPGQGMFDFESTIDSMPEAATIPASSSDQEEKAPSIFEVFLDEMFFGTTDQDSYFQSVVNESDYALSDEHAPLEK